MNLTTLPTHLSSNSNADTFSNSDKLSSASSDYMDSSVSGAVPKTITPNAIILADALTDTTISWRIHNCKISEKTLTQDKPLAFLYYYDSLDDAIKQTHPLTPALLAQFNTLMTADEAAKLIGIDKALVTSPWHVKVMGSLVVFSEALQLAVRLHWTNTGKATQQIYTKDADDAMIAAFNEWQFFGRVDVLYKNDKQALVSIDEQNASDEPLLTIDASTEYQQLSATHALTLIARLEADKAELPWFEAAILERIA
ncbi:hypothetical protein [uncultured Psychrobacter sp.]|uniref:hypothetical protein n=1 Tax=uncultured Psychrobacter sp. TaxID=259303 RepID=UPI002625B730|nr:hypothetical protein [uncultured Psychrobacter sp.]